MQSEEQRSLITNFQDNLEKVKRLDMKTTEEIAAKLIEKRQFYQNRIARIPGRKVKFALAFGIPFLVAITLEEVNVRQFIIFREQQVVEYEKQIYPFFQAVEDRFLILAQHRKDLAIEALFNDKEKKHFMEYYKSLQFNEDFFPQRSRKMVSNLGLPYGYRTILGTAGTQFHKQFNNPSI